MDLSKKLFKKVKPDIIVLPEENIFYQTVIYTKIAKKYSIPSVIVPYTIANETEMAEALYRTHQLKSSFAKLIGFFYPKWIYVYKHQRLILMSGWQILIYEILKLAPPNPWLINSGFSNAIAVESPFMMKYYLKNGLPSEQLVLTGSISDDIIFESQNNFTQKRKVLKEILHLDNRPILLCSLPPPQPFTSRKIEFQDDDQIISYWINTITQVKDFNVIFNLHPNLSDVKKALIKSLGVKILPMSIVDLIPLCDLYIASVSATIRWAIAGGKPVLNYDVYRYRYHDYDEAKGVITVESKRDFLKYLQKFTQDKIFYQEMVQKQEDCMKDWGMLDGKSGERILMLINDLISKRKINNG